jgi:hypothetical protein
MFYYSIHKVIDAPQYVITDVPTLPKRALKWMLKQKGARRPKKNYMEGIKKSTNERNVSEGQWEDRKWGLGVEKRRKQF